VLNASAASPPPAPPAAAAHRPDPPGTYRPWVGCPGVLPGAPRWPNADARCNTPARRACPIIMPSAFWDRAEHVLTWAMWASSAHDRGRPIDPDVWRELSANVARLDDWYDTAAICWETLPPGEPLPRDFYGRFVLTGDAPDGGSP